MKPGEGDFDQVIATLYPHNSGVGPLRNHLEEDWYGRRLIAGKFRRCAFIAGDAAHIWVPYAGYGMNAIADTMNLSWLPRISTAGAGCITDAYEAERWPITSRCRGCDGMRKPKRRRGFCA